MSAELSAAEVEALAETLTLAVLAHYGYTAEDVAEAEAVHPGRICLEAECYDEEGESVHPPAYDELHLISALMVDVVVPHVAALVAQAASERERALIERINEFDASDNYHASDNRPGYYAALDRVVRLIRGEITDWQSPRAALSPEAAS